MYTRVILCMVLLALTASTYAQRLERFSEDTGEFLSELEDFMSRNKQKAMDDTYKAFAAKYKGGAFDAETATRIRETGNKMLERRLSAFPYFLAYLGALNLSQQASDAGAGFDQWHSVIEQMIADQDNFKPARLSQFLDFSKDFFEHQSIRFANPGVSWYALSDAYQWEYNKEPILHYPETDLIGSRKGDSLRIRKTSGRYHPINDTWEGTGGRVSWERIGFNADVYAELGDYSIETKRSLYEVASARLHYPLYFGEEMIEGKFSDKLLVGDDMKGASYPRFESKANYLQISNIGQGIEYQGGFRLEGATVYGFGNSERDAQIEVMDEDLKRAAFRGSSSLFIIRQEERIVAERVETTIYFGKDSIYHPSVNIRFFIPERELQLTRGDRGSDRNPYYSSLHKVNIDADHLNIFLDNDSLVVGKPALSITRKGDVAFESLGYYRQIDYDRLQNISNVNPLAIMKVTAEREGTRYIDANLLATRIDSRFKVDNIQTLLYDMVSKGFINYYPDKQLVEIKEKAIHYVNANQERADYDFMRMESKTDSVNATMNMRSGNADISGLKKMEFSRIQRVAAIPTNGRITLKPNRDLDFSGKVFAGFSTLEGTDFHFKYDPFQIDLDSIREFSFYVPTGEVDQNGNPVAFSIGSRIENLTGVLLIDAPNNKSGREDILMFPSLQSRGNSYVYYDQDTTQAGVYGRDSFYYELTPFSFDHLDKYTARDLNFKGKLVSGGIFPDIEENLMLREEDQSLGFVHETPEAGLPSYGGKGDYAGKVSLSNEGLLGEGTLNYLAAEVNSEDFIFQPNRMLAGAERFDLEEKRGGEVETPQVRGENVKIEWKPYADSMYVRPDEKPFTMFAEEEHFMAGTLILTPNGLKGDGKFFWDLASMNSNQFAFKAHSLTADTTDIDIVALDNNDRLALETRNVKAQVDFDEGQATFEANDEYLETTLPYNQYVTSMNEFVWDMDGENIVFKAALDKPGRFTSIHPEQDSLSFDGKSAVYDLKSSLLQIEGVPYVVSADAFIYPDSNYVEIEPEAVMRTLNNAKIVADTINKNHVINRATVQVLGGKHYTATGFYQYDVAGRQQEIEFQDIIGTRVGKGKWNEKKAVTRAKGEIEEQDSFYIDQKTRFQGTISLSAESKDLQFDGFALLEAEKLGHKFWFTVSSKGEKEDLAISYQDPKGLEGEPLETGIFLSKEFAQVYPRVMTPLLFRKDRQLLPVKGVFKYDREKDQFIFGDSTKVISDGLKGNRLIFDNTDGTIEAEGRFNLGTGLKYISFDAAGRLDTSFPPINEEEDLPEPEEEAIMLDTDSLMTEPVNPILAQSLPQDGMEQRSRTSTKVTAEFMAGVKLILPDQLLKVMINDFKSSTFDSKAIGYLTDIDFYRRATPELFPQGQELTNAMDGMSLGYLDLPKKINPFTFLFSKLDMRWDDDYQSFVSTKKQNGIVSINGESINKQAESYIEMKMPSNDDDRLYIYIKSPSQLFYYFGYKQGILDVTSNNQSFMEELGKIKPKDLIQKMDDGELYEIQPVELGTANLFLRRIQAAQK